MRRFTPIRSATIGLFVIDLVWLGLELAFVLDVYVLMVSCESAKVFVTLSCLLSRKPSSYSFFFAVQTFTL